MIEVALDVKLTPAQHQVTAEAFGVRLGVGTPHPELVPRIRALMPPVARQCDPVGLHHHFTIAAADNGRYDVRYDIRDGEAANLDSPISSVATHIDLEFALGMLESYVRGALALTAPSHLFIAAGVVSLGGRAIVLPGYGLTGKTEFVSALVRTGVGFYSDEYAVLDEDGLVHPYRTALPAAGQPQASALNGSAGSANEPLPIGAVVVTRYQPGAAWQPRHLSRGEGVLALVPYAVPYQEEPERSTSYIVRALAAGPPVLVSDRDEAEPAARLLLEGLESLGVGGG